MVFARWVVRASLIMLVMALLALVLAPLAPMLVPTGGSRLSATPFYITNEPAGFRALVNTTAVAGYYCVKGFPGTGWSVILNAYLTNASGIAYITQDFIVSTTPVPTLLTSVYASNVWFPNGELVHVGLNVPGAPACGWLVVSIRGGIAYFGFSIDGRRVIWFDSYRVDGVIITTASMRVGGPGSGSQAVLDGPFEAVLALYYWGGGSWRSIISPNFAESNVLETVNHAWVSLGAYCGGVVSWPKPVNETICPGPPGFNP